MVYSFWPWLAGQSLTKGSTGRRPVRKNRPADRVLFLLSPLCSRCFIRKWVNPHSPTGRVYRPIYLLSILSVQKAIQYSLVAKIRPFCRRLPIIPQFLGPPRASLILACVEEYSWGLCLDRNNICGNSARAVKVLFQALQALTCLNVQSSKRKLNSLDLFLATVLPFAM